jgi:hypothetical protein
MPAHFRILPGTDPRSRAFQPSFFCLSGPVWILRYAVERDSAPAHRDPWLFCTPVTSVRSHGERLLLNPATKSITRICAGSGMASFGENYV